MSFIRKMLAVLLSVIMVCSASPLLFMGATAATQTYTEGVFTYEINSGKATILDINSSASGEITIPSKLGGYSVNVIGRAALANEKVTKYIVPEGIEKINPIAFCNSRSLKEVVLPRSVSYIGYAIFEGCTSIEKITIPFIGERKTDPQYLKLAYMFDSANPEINSYVPQSLKTIVVNESNSLGRFALKDCKYITSVEFTNGLSTISEQAFWGCSALTNISGFAEDVTVGEHAFMSCAWYNTLPEGVFYVGKTAFIYKTEPETKTVTIREGTTRIADYAFNGSSIQEIILPSGLKEVGTRAFYSCRSLKEINFLDGLEKIGSEAFKYCLELETLTMPDTVNTIGMLAFNNCSKLINITFPENVDYQGESGISGTAWFESQPDGCVYLGKSFYRTRGASPEILILKSGTTTIETNAMINNDSPIMVIPKSVTLIKKSAFHGDVSKIYYEGSQQDRENIEIQESNYGLYNVIWYYNYCGEGNHTYSSECDTVCNVCYCPCESTVEHTYDTGCDPECNLCGDVRTELTHTYANPFDTECDVCKSTRSITNTYFEYNDIKYFINSTGAVEVAGANNNVTELIIPESVYGKPIVDISNFAFQGNSMLVSVTIPDSITRIGYSSFEGCQNLKSVNIGKGVTLICSGAFTFCPSLETITVAKGNKKYHSSGNCVIDTENKTLVVGTNLSEIPQDGSVKIIGYQAFCGSGIEAIIIPENIQKIESRAFWGCESLIFIILNNKTGITVMSDAFAMCSSFQGVFFVGTEDEMSNITVDGGNDIFVNAMWFVNSCPVYGLHTTDGPCDTVCNECQANVIPQHVFDDETDMICNECGYDRTVPDKITSNTYTVSETQISKISINTKVTNLLSKLNEGQYCKIYKGNTEVSGNELVGTGMLVKIMDGNTPKATYTVVVTGDINGDGAISITDMVSAKSHILGKSKLKDEYLKAADTNGDGTISITDFVQIKANILGKGQITAR